MAQSEEATVIKRVGGEQMKAVRTGVSEELTVGSRDPAVEAAVAEAEATIKMRAMVARSAPRDEDQFRLDILAACRRPYFAELALFHKPVGRKKNPQTGKWEDAVVIDFSVHFVTEALRYFNNVYNAQHIVGETKDAVKVNVTVLDVQRNIGYSTDRLIEKAVERREVKQGRKELGYRQTASGEMVYLVAATRDEMDNLIGAAYSKLLRNNGKKILPRDILDECREEIDKTLANTNAEHPERAKKKILDSFATLGISAIMLKDYLKRPIEGLTANDLNELRAIHNALREGETNWTELMRSRDAEPEGAEEATPSLKDRVKQQAAELDKKPPEPTS